MSTDIKLQEVKRIMSKMTDCFIKQLSQLPNISETNEDNKNVKLKTIQTILDDIKTSEDTDSHLFRDSLKKAKGKHYSLQAFKPKTNYPHASTKQKFHEISQNDMPNKRPMSGRKGTPQYNSPSTWAGLKKQPSSKSQYKNHKYGRN